MSRKPRPRVERREQERAARKAALRRERLASLAPGGAPERPIDVAAASVVAVRARSCRCPRCGGALRLDEETAETVAGVRLRAARTTCESCHGTRTIWFRIAPPRPN